jgi:hypothetical protein
MSTASNVLTWLDTVITVVAKVEDAIGQLPRFDDGKLLMPESQAAVVAARLLDPAEIANMLLRAACDADPELESAISIAALNSQGLDRRRLEAALRRLT